MSRGSTHSRMVQRASGLPFTKKDKLRLATLGLLNIALGDSTARSYAESVLNLIGIKPKRKEEKDANEESNLTPVTTGSSQPVIRDEAITPNKV